MSQTDDDFFRRYISAAADIEGTRRALAAQYAQIDNHRGRISFFLFATYALAILGTLSAAGYAAYLGLHGTVDDEALESWLKIISVMTSVIQNSILPVATFVLGFYFGSEKPRH